MRLRESRDAFDHAIALAAQGGAGTLTYVGRFDLAEFAVVLEPDEPLRTARRAIYAAMLALTDALRACAPPHRTIAIDWPGGLRVDGGLVGGGRLGWPPAAREDEPPRWLVFGAMIRLVAMTDQEAGVHSLVSALDQEGFGDTGAADITESFARHLMRAVETWQADGFEAIARAYLGRLAGGHQDALGIADNGDLVTRRAGTDTIDRHELTAALLNPAWLDQFGGPDP